MWPSFLWLATVFAAVTAAVLAYQCPGGGLCIGALAQQIPDWTQHLQHHAQQHLRQLPALVQQAPGILHQFPGLLTGLWPSVSAPEPLERPRRNAPYVKPWNILHHLGGNSPWIQKTSGVADSLEPPPKCYIDQVHMISRHAERYPTVKAGIRMLELYQRLVHIGVSFEGDMEFINTWDFFMPDPGNRLESLIPTGPYAGTLQAFQTGIKLRTRYEYLVEQAIDRGQTELWASDSARVADTARYFAAGLYGLNWTSVAQLNVIPETSELGADTLTPGDTCANYLSDPDGHDLGASKLLEWQKTYLPPISERLHSIGNVSFTIHEIYTMQEMCGFETLAKGSSPWCKLFTHSEWEDFEYARDLLHYYRAGAGNKYGPSMGWLYLNATTELMKIGPQEAGPLYFSFVHDGDIVPFLASLDLIPQDPDLPSDRRLDRRKWRTSDVVPMGGRVILERIVCPMNSRCWDNGPWYPDQVYCASGKDMHYVRININDGVVRLPGCEDGPGASCELTKFKKHVEMRGKAGHDFRDLCGLDKSAPERITFLRQPPARAMAP